jgi:isoleucyl-tRNA synthetase
MLGRNARVDWHPEEMGQGRFGEWLSNNIDWAISRDRYWGTPLPVWVCDADDSHIDAVGSYEELAERAGVSLPPDFDPHKPHIDRYQWTCTRARCGGQMRRVPEVIDAWFDSGSMPFAQWHFPFENRARFERHYPGDFIAEGVDQTRGWFYSLLAIAAGLGDALPRNGVADGTRLTSLTAAPFRAVVVNDMVLDAEGQKMSKSRGNVVDPWQVIARHGADAVRLFLIASSQVWVPRRFDESVIRETAGQFLVTLKNVYSGMFAEMANFGWSPSERDPAPEARPPLDRWVLSRLAGMEDEVDALLGRYEATLAARALMTFFVDDVSKWYVRLSRARFYDVESPDNRAAFATLHEVLVVTCRLLAPFAPFISDWIHRELAGDSVHLARIQRPERWARDPRLEQGMATVRTLATLGRAAREVAGIRVRQPLQRMVCVVPAPEEPVLRPLVPLLEAELNVRRIDFLSSADSLVVLEARANFRTLGKKFGKDTKLAAAAIAALSGDSLRAFERGEPLSVSVDNESRPLDAEDLIISRRASGDLVVQEASGYFAAIDPTVTPELRREGLARELISRIQRMRKDTRLAVSDRIRVTIQGNEEVAEAVAAFRDRIAAEVLALDIRQDGDGAGDHSAAQTVDLDGITARVAITRVD